MKPSLSGERRRAETPGEIIRIQRKGDTYASFRAPGMSNARWKEYKDATDGIRFARDVGGRVVPLDRVPKILVRLREAGFGTEMDIELVRVLQQRTAQQWIDLKSAEDRINAIDAELHRRTGDRMFGYQKTGALWLTLRHGALLADEMGVGKTLQCIVALPARASVLIVAPAVAKGVWRGELRKWRPMLGVSTLEGRGSFRWPRPGEILITNYDVLPSVHDTTGTGGRRACQVAESFLKKNGSPTKMIEGYYDPEVCRGCDEELVYSPITGASLRPGGHKKTCTGYLKPKRCWGCHPLLERAPADLVLVADEAHKIKTTSTFQSLRFRALSDAIRKKAGRCWLLTGTPLENEPQDLWNVLSMAGVAEDAFGSYEGFLKSFSAEKKQFGGYDWGGAADDIGERLQRVMLRRTQEEVLPDLPELRFQDYEVDLDAKTLKGLDKLMEATGKTVADVVRLLEQDEGERKIGDMSRVRVALAAAKIPAMLALIDDHESRDEPVVVFSAHRAPIDLLEKRKGWAVITGDTSTKRRTEIVEEFQAGKLRGVGLMILAGGVAITLTRASRGISVDEEWTPSKNMQAYKRLHRIGQRSAVIVTRIVSVHELDKHVAEVNLKKMKIVRESVDAAVSKDDGGPVPARAFEDEIHRLQEEVAQGRAVRRMAETDDEKETLEKLRTVSFLPEDERTGVELFEEAMSIGLSKAQWSYAAKIVARVLPDLDDVEAVEEVQDQAVDAPIEVVEERGTKRPRSGWGLRSRRSGG